MSKNVVAFIKREGYSAQEAIRPNDTVILRNFAGFWATLAVGY
jgi:hypothetical protein